MLKAFLFHYGIPIYNLIYESINNTYNKVLFNYNNALKIFNLNTLYFYENNPNPYISSFIDASNNLNGVVLWKYNITNHTFYNYRCEYKDLKYLPILSATIQLHDKVICDITDFITSIKVESSNVNFPSLHHILSVYEYTYGIVLDRKLSYKLEYLDNELNEKTVDLFNSNFLFTNCLKN